MHKKKLLQKIFFSNIWREPNQRDRESDTSKILSFVWLSSGTLVHFGEWTTLNEPLPGRVIKWISFD